MAASTAKKPTAYREGRADKSKKPSIEIEIKPEGEEEEGMEGEEMDGDKPHSRKRSAKGAKHTKAPMDGGMYGKKPMDGEGCNCGKRKAKCDGSCGKKMDRNDALTPQEYLAACELGIQGRSRSYIRARLDAAERLDLKCGKGAISEGEKCHVGTAQKAQSASKRPSVRRGIATGAKYGALINGISGAAMGATLGSMSGQGLKGVVQGAAIGGLGNAASGAVLGGAIGGGVNAVRKHSYNARRRQRGLYDSVWADGFDPMEERGDLKCGKGAISEGEKCHVGPAQKVDPKTAAKKEFKTLMRDPVAANRFNKAKGNTKGVGNKIKAAGEFAARLGAGAAIGHGAFQTFEGAMKGNLGEVSRGFRNMQLGAAATQVAAASKASRMGKAELSKEFLKSAGRQVAIGVGQEAALGAYAGFSRTGGVSGMKRRARGAYQSARMRTSGMRSTPSGTGWASSAYDRPLPGRRDSVYATGFSTELDKLAI
jgi:hypothetical protein